ncbi:WD40-repeat-containing domain protein [Scenedesmus sp. NREL 46B-D3]|nr:WD40-repeat-containing domain protein [Scenedesmus sp. NREL 46B-D3]
MATLAHSLEPLQTLEGHTDRVWHLAWSPDGTSLASCSGDRTVRIWQQSRVEGRGWRCAAVLEDTHTKSIRCCCWSPGGTHLATASFDGTTAIWQLQGGIWEEISKLEGHENEVKAVAWSPCGNYLATCGRDKSVWFWERGLGEEYDCMDVKHGHSQDVKSVAWHPSKELLASCSYDNSIKLWANDEADWVCVQTLEGPAVGHSSTVWSVGFSRDGRQLASVSDDCTLRVWDVAWRDGFPPEPHCTLAACISGHHSRCIFTLDWSGQGLIATGDGANCIKLFGQPDLLEAAAAAAEAAAGAASSSNAADSSSSNVHRQAADTAAAPGTPELAGEQETPEEQLTGGPQGSTAAAAAAGNAESAWECLCSVQQSHNADVNCVRWHPSQQGLLASAGDDGVVKLWQYRQLSQAAALAAAGS